MTRVLPTGIAGELSLENAQRVHLLQLQTSQLATPTVLDNTFLTDAPQNVTVSGQVYTGIGGLVEIGDAEETPDDKGQGLRLALSGVDQSIVSTLLNNFYRGRYCHLHRVYLNSSGQVIGGKIDIFVNGYMNEPWRISATRDERFAPGTVRVETRIVPRHAVGVQLRGIRTNLTSHQRHFSGDLFFQHVSTLVGKKIRWGGAHPIVLGDDDTGQRRHEEE